jgi:hypothetical protein
MDIPRSLLLGADADSREQRQWKDIRHKYVEGGDDE